LKPSEFVHDDIIVSSDELNRHVQVTLDETHRDLAWIKTILVALLYGVLSVINYLTLEGEMRLTATMFAMAVTVSFVIISCFHRFINYPARLTNLMTFGELCVLQADSIAFSLVTNDIMSGFGVYVMIVSAGIFLTTSRWVILAVTMLGVTWFLPGLFSEASLDVARESLMMVSALFGAFFFFFVRLRSARRLSAHQLMELKYKESLEYALEHIDTLSGLLNICASCKSIRTEENEWTALDIYVRERADVEFTHSVCPTCQAKLYPGGNSA